MRQAFIGLFIALLSTSASYAFSGAEFLAVDPEFGKGYAWGALEYRLSIGTEEDYDAITKASACFKNAGINSDSFYQAVRTYFNGNVSALTQPAIAGVLKTSIAMCPWEK